LKFTGGGYIDNSGFEIYRAGGGEIENSRFEIYRGKERKRILAVKFSGNLEN